MMRIARGSSPARLSLAFVGTLVAFFGLSMAPVAAENPSEILAELTDDGIFIADSRSDEAEPGMFISVVEDARSQGVVMAVVWPEDPQPNTGAFARRVQEASLADVVLVFGPDDAFGSFVSEDFEEGSIRALSAARVESEPSAKASAYLTGLLDEPVRERPEIVNQLVRWIVLLLAALVVGAVGEQMIRAFKKSRKRQKLRAQNEAAS